eukprot:6697462-Ditylum_brightwellii.AAC.1
MEEAVEHVVLQAGNHVYLPTRCITGGCSHPCVICNSLSVGRKGTYLYVSKALLGLPKKIQWSGV